MLKEVKTVKKTTVPKIKTTLTLLDSRVSEGSQSLVFTAIYKLNHGTSEWKLRVEIKSDSISFQSFARVDVFQPVELKWNNLGRIPSSQMKTKHELRYGTSRSSSLFAEDADYLINRAKLILL